MEKTPLNDKALFPSDEVLSNLLGGSYGTYRQLIDYTCEPGINLLHEWRYYSDGYAWLCKVTDKKKTLCWLSAWQGYFKVTFYFLQRHKQAIMDSGISESAKQMYVNGNPVGKLIPVTLVVSREEQLEELKALIALKRQLR